MLLGREVIGLWCRPRVPSQQPSQADPHGGVSSSKTEPAPGRAHANIYLHECINSERFWLQQTQTPVVLHLVNPLLVSNDRWAGEIPAMESPCTTWKGVSRSANHTSD